MAVDPTTNEWVPDSWAQMLDEGALAPSPVLQPGLGIPADVVDQVAAMQPVDEPIEMVDTAPAVISPDSLMPNADELALAGNQPARASLPSWLPQDVAAEWGYATPVNQNDPMPPEEELDLATLMHEPANANASDIDLVHEGLAASEAPMRYQSVEGELAGLSDEDLARRALEAQQSRAVEFAREKEAAALRAHDEMRENYRAREEADVQTQKQMDALLAESTQLSQQKQDPERWWKSRSTGEKVLAVISAFLGGLAAPHMGGRNVGLEQIRKNIDEDIAAQLADLQNAKSGIETKRGMLAQQYAKHGDALRAAEEVRVASLEHVHRQLETEQLNYDPRGTIAMQIEVGKRQTRAAQAEAVRKYQTEEQKRALEVIKVRQAQAKIDEDQRHALETERNDRTKTYLDGQRLAFDKSKSDRDADLKRDEIAVKREEVAFNRQWKQEERDEKARTMGIGSPALVQRDEIGNLKLDKNGEPIVTLGAPLTNADGSEYKSRNPEEAAKLEKKIAVAYETNDILNRILEIRDRVGGESAVWNSDDYQRLKVLQNRVAILVKSGTEGMSSDSDMKRIAEAVGASDVTSFRSRAAGLEEGRQRLQSELTSAMQIARYTGKPLEFPGRGKAPTLSEADEEFKAAFLDRPVAPKAGQEIQASKDQRVKQEKMIGQLVAQATADPLPHTADEAKVKAHEKARADAIAMLRQVVDAGDTVLDDLRDKASQTLLTIGTSSIAGSKEEVR